MSQNDNKSWHEDLQDAPQVLKPSVSPLMNCEVLR